MPKAGWLFKVSLIIIIISAWLSLAAGFFVSLTILLGFMKDSPRWVGIVAFVPYLLLSAFLMLVSEMAKALMKIKEAIKKE